MGVTTDLLFEAPMELSEALRSVILKAQKLQQSRHQSELDADLGEYGHQVFALAQNLTISNLERIVSKQLAGVAEIKEQQKIQYNRANEQLLASLRAELVGSTAALQGYADELKAMREFLQKRSYDKSRRQFCRDYQQANEGIGVHLGRVVELLTSHQNSSQNAEGEELQSSAHQIDLAFAALIQLQLALSQAQQGANASKINQLGAQCLQLGSELPPAKLSAAMTHLLPKQQPKTCGNIFTIIQRMCVFCERMPKILLAHPELITHNRERATQWIQHQFASAIAMVALFIDNTNENDWHQLAMTAKNHDLQQQQSAINQALLAARNWK